MKTTFFSTIITICAICIANKVAYSQQPVSVEYSTYIGGSSFESFRAYEKPVIIVEDGFTYILGKSASADFPITSGAPEPNFASSGSALTISKFDSSDSLVFSTYLGSTSTGINFPQMYVENGFIYVIGQARTGYMTTSGAVQTTFAGGGSDYAISKIDPNGNLVYSTYLGGSGLDFDSKIIARDGIAYVVGRSTSNDFPTTSDAIQPNLNSQNDFILSILDPVGNLTYSTYLGGSANEMRPNIALSDSAIYMVGMTNSPDFPTSTGAVQDSLRGMRDYTITKFDLSGRMLYSTYLGGSGGEAMDLSFTAEVNFKVEDDNVYLLGITSSADFPVSIGATYPTYGGANDLTMTRLGPNGNIVYSTYLGGSGDDTRDKSLYVENGIAYIGALSNSIDFPTTADAVQSNKLGVGSTAIYTKVDPNGNIVYSTYLGGSGEEGSPYIIAHNENTYMLGATSSPDFPITSNAVIPNYQGISSFLTKFNSDNQLVYSTYWTRASSLTSAKGVMTFDNNRIYILGTVRNSTHAVTPDALQQLNQGSEDLFYTKLNICPPLPNNATSISPNVQNTCMRGLPMELLAMPTVIEGDSLPSLSINGLSFNQPSHELTYQWQVATSMSGPWTDVSNGSLQNYLPDMVVQDMHYRRLSFNQCCNDTLISEMGRVNVNSNRAPTVNSSPAVYTCAGIGTTIGGNPTATSNGGGVLTYAWSNGSLLSDSTVANPIATVNTSTIFVVTVTDEDGCSQIGQYAVEVISADAGPDQISCTGQGVRIGTNPIPGVDSLSYSWTVISGDNSSLIDSTIAQPVVMPTTTTQYELTVSLQLPTGVTCFERDTVEISNVDAPPAGFAGADVTICNTDMATLGVSNDPNYTYTWSPGVGLSNYNQGVTTFQSTFPDLPMSGVNILDPITFTLTATRNGCSFQDQVEVTVIEARAGEDGCGPRIIGLPDRTPNINETYSWTLVSGPNGFTGPTNAPQVPVSGSMTQTSVYRLEVCHNGVCCTDIVQVTPCGCDIDILVSSGGCAIFNNQNPVQLIASANDVYSSDPDDFTYMWTPQVGLDQYTGRIVTLTDNTPRTYTVTMMSPFDSTFVCTETIVVNQPNFQPPSFNISDTAFCAPTRSITIGELPNPNYTYEWAGPNSFISTIANPTITDFGEYSVTVIDQVTGCLLQDTISVLDGTPIANAGPDWVICDNAIIQFGIPDLSNGRWQYLWTPNANWQNGTNENSPQPELLVPTGTFQYTLTVTDTISGCSSTDIVNITASPNVTLPDAPDTTICTGETVMIGNPTMQNVQYNWAPATGLSCTNCAQPLASPTSTTTYTLEARFPGCTVASIDQVTVTVNSLNFDLGPNLTQCPSTGGVVINGPAGLSNYVWTPNIYLDNNTIQNPTANPPVPITYTLTATGPNGCTGSDQITVSPINPAPNAGNDATLCLEPNLSTMIGDPSNTGSITWSAIPASAIALLNSTTSPNPTFSPNDTGMYSFVITQNIAGCVNVDTIDITVEDFNLPPFPNLQTVCANGCVEVGLAPEPGVVYSWSPTTGVQNPTSSRTIICPTSQTQYTLTARRISNGCTASQNVTIFVASDNAPQVTIPDVDICLGGSTTLMPQVNPSGQYTYRWTPSNGLSDPNILNPIVFGTAIGTNTYSLAITDTSTNCNTIASVNVNTLTDALNIQSSATLSCSNNSAALTAVVTGQSSTATYNVVWSSNGDGTFQPSNTDPNATYFFGPNDLLRQNAIISLSASGGPCNISASEDMTVSIICPTVIINEAIPTLGEWGIIILILLFINLGAVAILNKNYIRA